GVRGQHIMRPRKNGFTLVELIVVIMILGILATIAVPRFLETSGRALDNATRSSLAVVRNAIELYTADHNGALPGQSNDLPGDLANYLRGDFPASAAKSNDRGISYYSDDAAALSADETTNGWVYSTVTGEFIVNSGAALSSDSSVTYDQL
ncbi:MAG: type II secretion system protein, partial [Planctomycetales bacterium]|nr:type II secretion system protein [Planctomycetales bacterium]